MGLQSTMTGILARLFPRLAKVVVGGTITTNSSASLFPTAISNEILGGHHGLDTTNDLANIPNDRLHVPMLATVAEHTANNRVIKRTTYVLEKIPTGGDRLSDIPGYDISEYWKVFSAVGDYAGTLQVQYAPNADALTGAANNNGGQPPFPGSRSGIRITQPEYNNLTEGDTVSIASTGMSIPGYWSTTYDASKGHVWQRQRFGSGVAAADWGIPVKISGESYESGDYIANIFKRVATIPDTPPQFVNGRPNNNPVGWLDTPSTGTQKLWMSKAQKDVYGQLKSPWTTPIEIVVNPQLVRYSEKATPNPNTLTYDETGSLSTPVTNSLTAQGWVEIYNPDQHRFMATRSEVSQGVYTAWVVIKISDESGEYVEYVFKNFKIEDTDAVLNNPDGYRPQGTTPLDWNDTPVASAVNEQLFVSSARKFFNGELMSIWSDPIPFSGLDSFVALVSGTPGDDFKRNPNVTPATVVPDKITLTAKLYRGVTEITTQTYQWTKFYDGGDLLDPVINLGTNPTIEILPADVTGKAIFKCVQTYQGMDFDYEYSILDIADGIDAKHLTLTANTNLLLARNAGGFSPSSIILKAYSSNLSDEGFFTWKKDGVPVLNQNSTPYVGDSLAVNYADFAIDPEITYQVISQDGLTDDWTIYKTNDASSGAPAVLMILSNESHTVVQDAGTLAQDLDGAKTKVSIFEGAVDVTADWTIRKIDTGVTSTPANGVNLPVGGFIQVTSIPTNSTSGYVTITATKGGQTLTKQFSITKIEDPIGSVLVDIDSSNNGFVFSPTVQTNKTLTANLYVDGLLQNEQINDVEWYLDSVYDNTLSSNTINVTPAMVNFQLTVRVRLQYRGLWYARTINLTDVKDAKGLGIRYTTKATDGINDSVGNPIGNDDKPPANIAYNSTGTAFNGSIFWSLNPQGAVYMSIRKEGDAEWGTPIRIKGESGSQGPQGNFIMNIFQWAYTIPNRPQGNPIPAGWSDAPPTNPNNGQSLWMSLGEITSVTPRTLVGQWSIPVSTSGKNGRDGFNGVDGADGDPLLTNGFNTNSQVTTASGGGNGTLNPNQLTWSFYTPITNNMPIDRHLVVQLGAKGYNSSRTSGSTLIGKLKFSNDGVVDDSSFEMLGRVGPVWSILADFPPTLNSATGFAAMSSRLSGISIHRIPANSTIWLSVGLENLGNGTLLYNNFNYNTYLL